MGVIKDATRCIPLSGDWQCIRELQAGGPGVSVAIKWYRRVQKKLIMQDFILMKWMLAETGKWFIERETLTPDHGRFVFLTPNHCCHAGDWSNYQYDFNQSDSSDTRTKWKQTENVVFPWQRQKKWLHPCRRPTCVWLHTIQHPLLSIRTKRTVLLRLL